MPFQIGDQAVYHNEFTEAATEGELDRWQDATVTIVDIVPDDDGFKQLVFPDEPLYIIVAPDGEFGGSAERYLTPVQTVDVAEFEAEFSR